MTTIFVLGKLPCGKKIKDKLYLPWIKTCGIELVRCCHVLKMGPHTSCRAVIN
jgi:hypothetical protein